MSKTASKKSKIDQGFMKSAPISPGSEKNLAAFVKQQGLYDASNIKNGKTTTPRKRDVEIVQQVGFSRKSQWTSQFLFFEIGSEKVESFTPLLESQLTTKKVKHTTDVTMTPALFKAIPLRKTAKGQNAVMKGSAEDEFNKMAIKENLQNTIPGIMNEKKHWTHDQRAYCHQGPDANSAENLHVGGASSNLNMQRKDETRIRKLAMNLLPDQPQVKEVCFGAGETTVLKDYPKIAIRSKRKYEFETQQGQNLTVAPIYDYWQTTRTRRETSDLTLAVTKVLLKK